MATSTITSDGSEEEEMDKVEGSDYNKSTTKTSGVEIEGMQMLTREQSKNKRSVTGQEEESGENQRVMHSRKKLNSRTKNMNKTKPRHS